MKIPHQYRGRPPHTVRVYYTDGTSEELCHHVRHSPTGFSWGYGGSGPSDLARSILLNQHDHVRTYRTSVDDEVVPPSMYHDFKFQVIALLPQDAAWTISADLIETWRVGWQAIKKGE